MANETFSTQSWYSYYYPAKSTKAAKIINRKGRKESKEKPATKTALARDAIYEKRSFFFASFATFAVGLLIRLRQEEKRSVE